VATQTELLQFKIEALGDEQLSAISRELIAVGKAGGEAAPQANALLERLADLASQSDLISTLVREKVALQETGDALALAKLKLGELQTQMAATTTPSAALERSFSKTQATITTLDAAYNQHQANIARTSNALKAAGVDTEHLDAAQRDSRQTLTATSEAAAGLAAAHGKNSAAAKEEAVTVQSLSEKYGLFGKVVESVKTILLTVGAFIGLEKAKEALDGILEETEKAEKFGVTFANAFGGVEKGAEALQKVNEIAEQTPLKMDDIAAAALRAKREGLDPFDGTLQALIAANDKYGGSIDTLNPLIDALGKAYAKGSLGTRELVSLQQQGIPVAQLLGEALGKTADEIEDMAKKGEIGRESIKLLITQLGESAAGDTTRQMSLLSTVVTKLHDQWEDFLTLIGQSGVYDFVRDKLQAINTAFKQGIADGTIAEKARAISGAVVALGQAVGGTLKFLYDHAAAIGEAVKAYITFKTVLLAADIGGAAARMLALATATRTAGQAAEIAAAESGAFGKLRGVLGRIPTGIQIAIATAGVEFATSQLLNLIDAEKKLYDENQRIKELDQDRANTLTVLASKAEAIAQRLSGFAKTQIVDADQLAAKNRSQSEEYIAQLENATRYYTALRIQAQSIGDTKGAADAATHLKDLAAALDEAAKHAKELTDKLSQTDQAVNTVVNRFDDLKTKGESSASAIESAFNKIEIQTPQGLQNALDIIQQVSIRSKDAKQAVQAELVGALQKLDETDLRNFQQNVSQRLKDAKGDADALKTSLQAGLEAELLKLGLTAEQAGVQFTASGQKIIDTFSLIATNAAASGNQIQLAFAKALDQAQTVGEVNALKQRLQDAFDAGRISASQFQAGMEATGRKLADVQVAAAKAGAELDGMGKEGTTAAQRISFALQDTRDKLVVQANQIATAITKALQAGDTASADQLRGQFKAVDTQIQELNTDIGKLTPSYDSAGDAGERAGQRMAEGADRATAGLQQSAGAAGEAGTQIDETTRKAEEGFTAWGDSADAAALATRGITADTSHANDGINDLTQGIAAARVGFLNVSEAAAKAYDTILKGAFDLGHTNDGSGFDRVARAMQVALDETNKEIADQRSQLQGIIALTSQVGTESVEDFSKLSGTVKYTNSQLGTTIESIKAGTYDAGLLGQQELGPFLAALEAAKQRVDALTASEKQASQQIADLNSQLQDQLDQQSGNKTALENRDYEAQRKHIEDLAAQADASGKVQAAQALQRLEELHQAKLKAIADEAAVQRQADQQRTAASNGNASGAGNNTGTGGNGAGASASNGSKAAGQAGSVDVNVNHNLQLNLPKGDAFLALFDDSVLSKLASALIPIMGEGMAHQIVRQLQLAKSRAGG
jgi:tape measure domain-containing protein